MRKVSTISILTELRVFGEMLSPRLREKEANTICKNVGLVSYTDHK